MMSEICVLPPLRQLIAVLLLLAPTIALTQPTYENLLVQESDYLRSKGEISRLVERQLHMDAARLSLRSEGDDLRHASIHIAEQQRQAFYQLLRSIYLYDQRMIDCFHIQTAAMPSTDYIRLVYQKDVTWAAPLQRGISSTDHPLINGLMERYDLVIEYQETLNVRQDVLHLRAVNPINMAALASNFYGIEGIEAVDVQENKAAKSDINIRQKSNAWELQYLLRFGELDALEEHRWTYRIKANGAIDLVSESGAYLPSWITCE